MRNIAHIAIFLLYLGCSSTVAPENIVLSNITFYDSYGRIYNSNTASSQVQKEYQLQNKPIIILIATNATNQDQFIKQMKVIANVNPEDFQYMYIIANSEEEDNSGYFTAKDVASNLLSGRQFKVIINDQCGKPIKTSYNAINETELKHCLTRAFSGSQGPCAH